MNQTSQVCDECGDDLEDNEGCPTEMWFAYAGPGVWTLCEGKDDAIRQTRGKLSPRLRHRASTLIGVYRLPPGLQSFQVTPGCRGGDCPGCDAEDFDFEFADGAEGEGLDHVSGPDPLALRRWD
jgi:hypothetical protein